MKKISFIFLISVSIFLSACSLFTNEEFDKNHIEFHTQIDQIDNISQSESDTGLSDSIKSFLEQNLAWTNNPDWKAFCNYNVLWQEWDKTYLRALCEEFYVQDKNLICPDIHTIEDCFVSKTRQECNICDMKTVTPYLSLWGWVSMPLILTKTGNTYDMRQPRDWSYYGKDIKTNFPSYIDVFGANSKNDNLRYNTIQDATKYFNVNPKFDITENLDQSCQTYLDCGDIPFDAAIRSNCPHTVACIENQCAVGCYDFTDHVDMPMLKD